MHRAGTRLISAYDTWHAATRQLFHPWTHNVDEIVNEPEGRSPSNFWSDSACWNDLLSDRLNTRDVFTVLEINWRRAVGSSFSALKINIFWFRIPIQDNDDFFHTKILWKRLRGKPMIKRWPKILKNLYDFRATNKQRMFFSIPEIAILTTPEIFC